MSIALSAPPQAAIPQADPGPDWKQQLADRLDAYRAKHPEHRPSASLPSNSVTDTRASRIARTVASRYASAPTYRDLLLAASAERETRNRCTTGRTGRNGADAAPPVDKEPTASAIATAVEEPPAAEQLHPAMREPSKPQSGIPVLPPFHARTGEMHLHQPVPEPEPTLEDLWASSLVEAREVLPSKLIEFPRELVSQKRARPRLPEMPETADAVQLRIFEVQPETLPEAAMDRQAPPEAGASDTRGEGPSAEPGGSRVAGQTVSTQAEGVSRQATGPLSNASSARAFKDLEWAAISLDRPPIAARRAAETKLADSVPFLVDPAGIDRRLMAFAVDFSAVTAGFFAFLLVFAASTPHLPAGATAVVLAGTVYAALWVLYQVLFFSLSGATAGMVYARIALCTFDEQNPTRSALRRRLAAWWLSCLPLGLGFFWCFVDEDNLSWHDRMTRTYQREY